jgi:thiol-disulfide isomerase/thioredoxin
VDAFAGPGLDGSEIKSAEFAGKIWLLDFWATWCGPCRGELPNVVKLAKATAGKPFAILSVSLDKPDQKDQLKAFVKDHEMAWKQIYDGKAWQGPICEKFEIHSIPATFLVDENMKVVRAGLRGKELETVVLAQLARLAKGKKK